MLHRYVYIPFYWANEWGLNNFFLLATLRFDVKAELYEYNLKAALGKEGGNKGTT